MYFGVAVALLEQVVLDAGEAAPGGHPLVAVGAGGRLPEEVVVVEVRALRAGVVAAGGVHRDEGAVVRLVPEGVVADLVVQTLDAEIAAAAPLQLEDVADQRAVAGAEGHVEGGGVLEDEAADDDVGGGAVQGEAAAARERHAADRLGGDGDGRAGRPGHGDADGRGRRVAAVGHDDAVAGLGRGDGAGERTDAGTFTLCAQTGGSGAPGGASGSGPSGPPSTGAPLSGGGGSVPGSSSPASGVVAPPAPPAVAPPSPVRPPSALPPCRPRSGRRCRPGRPPVPPVARPPVPPVASPPVPPPSAAPAPPSDQVSGVRDELAPPHAARVSSVAVRARRERADMGGDSRERGQFRHSRTRPFSFLAGPGAFAPRSASTRPRHHV